VVFVCWEAGHDFVTFHIRSVPQAKIRSVATVVNQVVSAVVVAHVIIQMECAYALKVSTAQGATNNLYYPEEYYFFSKE
jgi:hypothetical protein